MLATLVLFIATSAVAAVGSAQLLALYPVAGDALLPVGDDQVSAEITLATGFVFFGVHETSLFVSLSILHRLLGG